MPLRSGKAEKYSVVVRATKDTILEVLDSSYNWYSKSHVYPYYLILKK